MTQTVPVAPGFHAIELGPVNAFVATAPDGAVLIDAGSPGDGPRLLDALAGLGVAPAGVTAVIVTHHHPDHAGGLAHVLAATGAAAWMHPADAADVRVGNGYRPYRATSGLLNWTLERTVVRPMPKRFEPAPVAHEVADGDVLPGGFVAVHAPGHSRGQIALYDAGRRLLVAADACSNLPVLGYSIVYEDFDEGAATLRRLAALDVDTVVFGHGAAIVGRGGARLRERFAGARGG